MNEYLALTAGCLVVTISQYEGEAVRRFGSANADSRVQLELGELHHFCHHFDEGNGGPFVYAQIDCSSGNSSTGWERSHCSSCHNAL